MSARPRLARDVVDHGIVLVACAVSDGRTDDEAARVGLEFLMQMSAEPIPADMREHALDVYRMVAAATRGDGFAVVKVKREERVN